ncbi:hypothetical protein AURDEDRAFT_135947 [Auricularia subglabra TFB-10046 SS5]|nr:hypothetical protein AURDEDRAFT_135947 [Auricularia subglabra TFB-10046 SS5]
MPPPRVVCIYRDLPSAILRGAHDAGLIDLVSLPESASATGETRRAWFLSQLPGAHAIIVWSDAGRIGKEQIDIAGGSLRVVATFSVGYELIDVEECKRRGVAVAHTPFKSDDAVANGTLLLMLTAMRRLIEHVDLVRNGEWLRAYNNTSETPLSYCGGSVQHRTVGFYGFGRIAQKVVERLLPMAPARILYKTSSPKEFAPSTFPRLHALVSAVYPTTEVCNEPDLETLAAESDFLVCLTSLNPETHHSINAKILAKMKKHAILINMSRGGVVDTPAVVDALKNDGLSSVALDVLEGEPRIPADHPLLDESLRYKVLITPHTASAEVQTRTAMAELTARNVLAALGIDLNFPVPGGSLDDRSTYFLC